jgi:mono/diheme cytochrome c family protein
MHQRRTTISLDESIRLRKKVLAGVMSAGLLLMSLIAWGNEHDTKWIAPEAAAVRKNPIAADQASVQAGKKTYKQECYSCHGKGGVGNGPQAMDLETPPGNLQLPEVQAQSDGTLFWKITEGKKPMPTLKAKLTDADRWNVVNYLRTFKK